MSQDELNKLDDDKDNLQENNEQEILEQQEILEKVSEYAKEINEEMQNDLEEQEAEETSEKSSTEEDFFEKIVLEDDAPEEITDEEEIKTGEISEEELEEISASTQALEENELSDKFSTEEIAFDKIVLEDEVSEEIIDEEETLASKLDEETSEKAPSDEQEKLNETEILQELQTETYQENLDETENISKKSKIKGRGLPKLKKSKTKIKSIKENKKLNTNLSIYISSAILLVLIIILILVFTFIVKNIKAKNLEKQQEVFANMSVSERPYSESATDQEFIVINKQQSLDGQTIFLDKILLDEKNTYLYFKNFVDILKFDTYIIDENNKLYSRDLTFNSSIDGYETVLRFQPIKNKTGNFKLYFVNNLTKEEVFYSILIPKESKINETRFLNKPVSAKFEDFDITISSGTFSGASSNINYFIENKSDRYTIQSGPNSNNESIYLTENGLNLNKFRNVPLTYQFEKKGTYLNRMYFSGASSLDSKLTLHLSDLYKKYRINSIVSANEFSNTKNKIINLDKYNIVLEGLAKFNDTIVLVFYAEDTTIDNSVDENANRLKVDLDAEVIVKTPKGFEVIINGTEKSSEIGTDMLFNVPPEYSKLLSNVTNNNIKVNIKSALISIDDAKIDIDLSQAMTRPVVADQILDKQIENYFKSRAAYKSAKLDLNSIQGFDSTVLANENLMKHYQPQNAPNSVYSTQIIFKGEYGDSLYYIIQEHWKESAYSENSFYTTHKVKLNQNESGKWSIVLDEIIK